MMPSIPTVQTAKNHVDQPSVDAAHTSVAVTSAANSASSASTARRRMRRLRAQS
ncbi:hypothetical protein SAMN04515665_1313 [Blastococcus sp. DSM 46786]|nr:hypothetical protein SAMN04515665_1313 [Blastococcus sp. DSM 46786]